MTRKYYLKHKKEIKKKHHEYYIKNRKKMLRWNKNYKNKHKEHYKKLKREWYVKNRKRLLKKRAKYFRKHRNKLIKELRTYYKDNKEKCLKQNSDYARKRSKIDLGYKLSRRLRSRLGQALKNRSKRGSAVRDLGCSIEFLIAYLQEQFYGNITWDNYGSYWDIDHIKALCFFDLTNRRQLLKAVHYTNLQPLTKKDHLRKTTKERQKLRKLKQLKRI